KNKVMALFIVTRSCSLWERRFSRFRRKSRHQNEACGASYNELTKKMTQLHRLRLWAAAVLAVAAPVVCLAAKEFSMPKAQPAFSFPAHDHHSSENVTVAVDPYDTPAKEGIFLVKYREHELLPILLII